MARYKLAAGDRLLLCTDGLMGLADDGTIAGVLGRGMTAAAAARALINLPLGCGDNATAAVAIFAAAADVPSAGPPGQRIDPEGTGPVSWAAWGPLALVTIR